MKRVVILPALARRLADARNAHGGVLVPGISAVSLRDLGACLQRIADGEDARKVFSQPKRGLGKPAKTTEHFRAVVAYYRHRVKHPTDAAGAAELVGKRYGMKRSTIERLARAHCEDALFVIEQPSGRWEGTKYVTGRNGPDTSALRAYLAKKAKGGNRPK